MATPTYTITRDNDTGLDTATVIFSDGTILAINSTNENYPAIVEAVAIKHLEEDVVRDLMRPHLSVGKSLKALSERVRYDEGNIYFDGDAIDNSLARHIVRIVNEGGDENKYKALVNFMEKLYSNPSEKSRDSLYDFLLRQDFTILPNGDFIAYKGLRKDATSIHAGFGIVDGVAFQNTNLKNEVGSVIEIPRSQVDDDTRVGCSTGLHAGSYAYAKDFARGLLVTVQINPRDVVSVPEHANFQKIRTCRYTVLAHTEVEIKTTTWTNADNDWDDDEDSDYGYCDSCGGEFDADDLDENGECEDCRDDNQDYGDDEPDAQTRADADDATRRLAEPVKTDSAEVPADPNKPSSAEFAAQLLAEIEGDENIVLGFNYTNAFEQNSHVEGYAPTELFQTGGDVLIKGQNAEGQWRSYYYSRMTDITVREDDDEGRHAL